MSSLLEEHAKGVIFIKRILISLVPIILLIALLIYRLFFLQILSFNELKNRSENNRIKVGVIPPIRGNILDRKNNRLTNNRNSYELIFYKSDKIDYKIRYYKVRKNNKCNFTETNINKADI